jgi:hypothetical protein
MPNLRVAFACAVVDGAAYLVGGYREGPADLVDAIERYDPFVETWSSPTRLQTLRYGLSAPVVGKRIITLGGTAYTGPYSASNPFPSRPVDVVEILDTERL